MLTITIIALVLAIPLSSITSSVSASLAPLPLSSTSLGTGNEFEGVGTRISATLFTRIVAIALIFAALLSYNALSFNVSMACDSILDTGVGLYSGLIHASTVTQMIEVFLFVTAALILLPWSSIMGSVNNRSNHSTGFSNYIPIPEYPLIILFTTIGATFLFASADLVSIYLAIELQSFGVYILAALYRDSESATAAGLKYFLLGALSSALILLGSALVYGYTGLTNLDSIYELISVPSVTHLGLEDGTSSENLSSLQNIVLTYTSDIGYPIQLGFILISVGLLFKVASAPFHYWAPDVYDGTPTIVTTWLTVMPKISLFIFLLELCLGSTMAFSSFLTLPSSIENLGTGPITNLLLVCAFLSLVIGTVVGLGQYRIKRLFAYSTISHVGFLLLALASISTLSETVGEVGTVDSTNSLGSVAGQESVESFLFYIVQYSLTNINLFFILLAFGYFISTMPISTKNSTDIQFTSELQGQLQVNPILGLSFAICLFSMAGIPPLVGFFAKYTVLSSAIHNGYLFLAIIAILASVVSAVYYLRIIRVIHFDNFLSSSTSKEQQDSLVYDQIANKNSVPSSSPVTSVHSYVIASLTLFILLFAVNPTLILNSTTIMALSLFMPLSVG